MEGGLVRVADDLLGEAQTGVVKETVAGEDPGPELRERGGRRRCTGEGLVQVVQLTADRLGVAWRDQPEPDCPRRRRGRQELGSGAPTPQPGRGAPGAVEAPARGVPGPETQ